MSIRILQINTALQEASVSISADGNSLVEKTNPAQQEHAGFLQPAIADLLKSLNLSLNEMNAVAVVNGPGSYTGLRVGLSAAKGICYAKNIPLILINTLDWLAMCNLSHVTDLICPMIDARRMEVFTAVYNNSLQMVMPPQARILEPDDFQDQFQHRSIHFIGDGAAKWKTICNHPHAVFPDWKTDAGSLAALSFRAYGNKGFADLAYCEPFYTKDFHSTQ